MANAQNRTKSSAVVAFIRSISFFLRGHAFVLLCRQVQILFREPIGYWLFGGALILISAGFTAQYSGYTQQTINNIEALSRLGLSLLHYYRLFSLLTIVIFVPVIGVSAITQEREAKTLDLLLTTGVPPLELVFSKVAASILVVFIAIFATSPILGLTLSMGGVSPLDVVTLSVLQLFLALVSVSVGVAMGARLPNFLLGLVSSYGILGATLLPAYSMAAFGSRHENVLRAYPGMLIMLIVSYILLKGVPEQLTREVNKIRPISWRPISIKGVDAQLWTFLGTRDYGTPIGSKENPVYVSERERFLSYVTRRDFDAPSVLWLISIFFFYWALTSPTAMLNMSILVTLFFVPGVGATMYSGEHERQSWDSLRSSLISSSQIFWGKLKLTVGQGWIHVFAFYIPSLIILGLIWILFVVQSSGSSVSYFHTNNTYRVWVGHILILTNLAFLVFFIGSMSIWISTIFKRNFLALMCSYGVSAFFLYLPKFLSLMHPKPGPTLGGNNPMDLFSMILSIWHSPFIFTIWPKATSQVTPNIINHLFWNLYYIHLIFLAAGSVLFCLLTRARIKLSDG